MKKSNFCAFVILVASVLFLPSVSCEKFELKKEFSAPKSIAFALAGIDSMNINNYFWLVGDQVINALDSGIRVSVQSGFTDSITHNAVGIMGMTVNSRNLYAKPDFSIDFQYTDTAAYKQEGLNLFGTNVNVKITGSSTADTVTKTIYMPKKVLRKVSDFPSNILDISKNLTLNWITDPSNSWGQVAILVIYNSSASQFLHDPTLPGNDTALSYTVPDNGSYTISTTDLLKLKANSIVQLVLGRGFGIQAILPISQRRVFYYATSSVTTDPITLIGPNYPVYGSNNLPVAYNMTMTNLGTNTPYAFHFNQNTADVNLGLVPPGKYNIIINHGGASNPNVIYKFNNLTTFGNSAVFTNVTVSGINNVQIMSNAP